jgi:hypothetical protein
MYTAELDIYAAPQHVAFRVRYSGGGIGQNGQDGE